MSNGKNEQEIARDEEQEINRDEVEETLQRELENIQSAVEDQYYAIVKTAVEDALNKAGLDKAEVRDVSVEPPDYIIPSQSSKCFGIYVPKIGHIGVCIPS